MKTSANMRPIARPRRGERILIELSQLTIATIMSVDGLSERDAESAALTDLIARSARLVRAGGLLAEESDLRLDGWLP